MVFLFPDFIFKTDHISFFKTIFLGIELNSFRICFQLHFKKNSLFLADFIFPEFLLLLLFFMQFSLFFPHLGNQFVFHDDHLLLFSINRLEGIDFVVGRTKIHQFRVEICLCSLKRIKLGQKSLLPFEIS